MYILITEYLECDKSIKIVIRTKKKGFSAKLVVDGNIYIDSFNDEEPYDVKTHLFYVDKQQLKPGDELVFKIKKHKRLNIIKSYSIKYNPVFADEKKLYDEYNSHIETVKTETESITEGVAYYHYICKDKNDASVHAFALEINPEKASLYIGTPNDGYESINVKAKVPEMIDSAVKNGVPVVAAMNADFFDMFGDCHPSGICVKNGRIIANKDSKRPFIAISKDGTPLISSVAECPEIPQKLSQAAAGLEMIVKDGKPFEWGPLEPFSFVRHPRTAAGIKADGTIILLEVDGRIPEYSNGATLVDLAEMMISFGADRAINLDGGGSSIVYTKENEGFKLRNNPADLIRPRAKLIRKEFDALLVVEKGYDGPLTYFEYNKSGDSIGSLLNISLNVENGVAKVTRISREYNGAPDIKDEKIISPEIMNIICRLVMDEGMDKWEKFPDSEIIAFDAPSISVFYKINGKSYHFSDRQELPQSGFKAIRSAVDILEEQFDK